MLSNCILTLHEDFLLNAILVCKRSNATLQFRTSYLSNNQAFNFSFCQPISNTHVLPNKIQPTKKNKDKTCYVLHHRVQEHVNNDVYSLITTVCPYGDRIENCKKNSCNLLDGCSYAENCCGTCSYERAPECTDVSNIDGMSCDTRVKLHGLQECYNCTVADSCCVTCTKFLTSQPGT